MRAAPAPAGTAVRINAQGLRRVDMLALSTRPRIADMDEFRVNLHLGGWAVVAEDRP